MSNVARLPLRQDARARPLTLEASAEVLAFLDDWLTRHPAAQSLADEVRVQVGLATPAASSRRFWKANLMQMSDVLANIRRHSKRLRLALAAWEIVCREIDERSFLLKLDRDGLMARLAAEGFKVRRDHVLDVLGEFVAFGALLRVEGGREVRWMLNPNIATRLSGEAEAAALRAAGNVVVLPDPRQLGLL